MPRDDELQWIDLTDFSPGIFSSNNLAGGVQVTAANPAYASPTNTYRCRALPSGGLGPLPRRTYDFGLTTIPEAGNGFTYIINGLGTWGQVFGDTGLTDFDHRIEVHLPISWTEDTGADYAHEYRWVRERIYEDPASTEIIRSVTATGQTVEDLAQYAYFGKTRMNPTTPDSPGTPVMAHVYTNWARSIFTSRVQPDPASASTNSTLVIGTENLANSYRRMVTHQGRIVIGKYDNYDRGDATSLSTDENVIWTETNDDALVSVTAAVFVPEEDASISDWASMSANQLVVIKSLGGGYVLQGDLSDVTVVRLPNLMSPDGSETVRGCNTEKGWVYSAGDRGLYLWNGGDAATPISTQLDGRAFTDSPGANFGDDSHVGQCDRWIDMLLAPQLWVMDLEKGGWWRLDDPADFPTPVMYWSTSKYLQQTVGARATFTDASPECFYIWTYNDLAYTYSWQSQPLWISRGRRMEVRQGVVALQGHGQVTITVTDDTADSSSYKVIDIDSDVIRNYRFDLSTDAENLTIRIEASGNDGDGPGTYEAPLVHRLFIGWREAQHLRNANQQ